MLAYKFRSPQQIEFTLDILFNNRLYCAEWTSLNDPMEGVFGYSQSASDEKDWSKLLNEIKLHKKQVKICSLSSTFDCHLLWAHYADGFRGMAIEVELPNFHPDIVEVKYRGVFASIKFEDGTISYDTARTILSSKYHEWEYEKEIRILNDNQYYNLDIPVRRIIVGQRMKPALVEALQIICESKDIPIYKVGIGDEGIDADYVPKLGERW